MPDTHRITLTGLRPQAYEHPWDRQALDALERTRGLDILIRKLNEWGYERFQRVQLTGSHLRVTQDSFPDLHSQVALACETLHLPRIPEVYIASSGEINAFTSGVKDPIIVLTSGAIDTLTSDELLFVIGHELGHIKSSHVLYYQIANFLPVVGDILGSITLGLGDLLSFGLKMALLNWARMSEFTADRAGFLVTQDIAPAMGAMMKLAGLPHRYRDQVNIEDFIAQARAFEALDSDKISRFAKWISIAGQSHPWTVLRANQFMAWFDSGDYQRIIDYPSGIATDRPIGVARFCIRCGFGLSGGEAFCPGCGTPIDPPP